MTLVINAFHFLQQLDQSIHILQPLLLSLLLNSSHVTLESYFVNRIETITCHPLRFLITVNSSSHILYSCLPFRSFHPSTHALGPTPLTFFRNFVQSCIFLLLYPKVLSLHWPLPFWWTNMFHCSTVKSKTTIEALSVWIQWADLATAGVAHSLHEMITHFIEHAVLGTMVGAGDRAVPMTGTVPDLIYFTSSFSSLQPVAGWHPPSPCYQHCSGWVANEILEPNITWMPENVWPWWPPIPLPHFFWI